MFKRTLLAAITFSMIAIPVAQAQSRYDGPGRHPHYSQPAKPKAHSSKRVHKPQVHQKHQWRKGQRMQDWRRHSHVRDYHRHGLKRPASGQQWVRVNNDYLLVSIATGLIVGLVAGR